MHLTRLIRVAALTAATVSASVTIALAQGVPAEIPPASYAGDQYTDSRGCIFVRVGVGANTEWVPRVGRDRNQLCGYTPTLGSASATASAAPAANRTEGVTVIGAPAPAATATATATSRPAATATAPAAPAVRTVATQPRPVATEPRPVATTPRVVTPAPAPAAPAASGPCANLPADVARYITGPGARCGPQAVHPGDALRSSALGGDGAGLRQVVRYEVDPPPGYRAAWDDDRLNPYRGLTFAGGQRQMEQVWTNTVPRRLVGDEPRGFAAVFTRANRPATLVPAELVILRP